MAPKPKGEIGTTKELGVGGGTSDKLSDIYQRLGSIQSSVTYLEGAAHDSRADMKSMREEITIGRATFNTLKWVLGIVGTILVLMWGFITAIVAMAVKHYLNW